MILIKGGRVVDPMTGTDEILDVLIKNHNIVRVDKDIDIHEDDRVIDATGLVVAPGLMDGHVHFRDPGFTHKETIETGAAAAKRGGFTTVVCMANTNPPVDNTETLNYILEKGSSAGIHVLSAATVTVGMKGEELVDMVRLSTHGASVFTDDGLPIMNEKLLLQAFKKAKELHTPVSLHEEDPAFIDSHGINQGFISEKLGLGGANRAAEDVMVARDCALALHAGTKLCIQHVSSKNSVEIIRAFKTLGADVHAEATPHHFSLTEDAVEKYGTNAKMNPPLRTEEDRQAIIRGIADGTLDMIVTDHAPHAEDEKNKEFNSAPSGIIGLETSLGLAIKNLVQIGAVSLIDVLARMSLNPARFYGRRLWKVAEGSAADLVIFGENEEWRVDSFASKSKNSPFIGMTLPGRVHYTICGGEIVYEGKE